MRFRNRLRSLFSPAAFLAIGAGSILVACHGGSAQHSVPLPQSAASGKSTGSPLSGPDRRLDNGAAAVVAADLPKQERDFVRTAASVLRVSMGPRGEMLRPEDFQIAVLDGKTGKMFFNRSELRGTMRAVRSNRHFDHRPQSVSTGVALQRGRRPLVYNGKPFPDANSGPYRRIYTRPNFDPNSKGIGFISAAVYTNCSQGNSYNSTTAAQQNQNLREDGNLLLGGWSMQDNAVDAGLIYNKGLQASSQDDYSPIFAISNAPMNDAIHGPFEFEHYSQARVNWHIPCWNTPPFGGGQPTYIAYFVDMPINTGPNQPGNKIELVAQFQYFDPGIQRYRQIDLIYVTDNTNDWNGWSVACNQCVFKRETTIAQKSPAHGGKADTFNNGDYFYGTWSSTQVSCGLTTHGCDDTNGTTKYPMDNFAIKACEEYPAWTDYHDDQRDCNNNPSSGNNHIQVSGFSYDGEMDLIDLHPDASPPSPNPSPFPTPLSQSMYFQPVFSVASDGLHVGMNISNDGNSSGPPVTKTYEWSRNSPYHFLIYQVSPYQLVYDSWAGARFTDSLFWETWAPNETKHVEAVWPGYSAGTTYNFVFQSNPKFDLGANILSQNFSPGDVFRSAEPDIAGDTPVYPEGTPPPSGPCTPDQWGACGYYWYLNMTYCDDGFGTGPSYANPWYYTGYSALTGQRREFQGSATPVGPYCNQWSINWMGGSPQEIYNDPNLPGPYDMPPLQ